MGVLRLNGFISYGIFIFEHEINRKWLSAEGKQFDCEVLFDALKGKSTRLVKKDCPYMLKAHKDGRVYLSDMTLKNPKPIYIQDDLWIYLINSGVKIYKFGDGKLKLNGVIKNYPCRCSMEVALSHLNGPDIRIDAEKKSEILWAFDEFTRHYCVSVSGDYKMIFYIPAGEYDIDFLFDGDYFVINYTKLNGIKLRGNSDIPDLAFYSVHDINEELVRYLRGIVPVFDSSCDKASQIFLEPRTLVIKY